MAQPERPCEGTDWYTTHRAIHRDENTDARTIHVTYKGDVRTVDGKPTATMTLSQALCMPLSPGDVIQLHPGEYWPAHMEEPGDNEKGMVQSFLSRRLPFDIVKVQGKPEKPITIRGMGRRTVLRGGVSTRRQPTQLPVYTDFSFFRLLDCRWLVFEDLTVDACWPTFSFIQNSRYITYRKIRARDSRYLIFARGGETHHLLLEKIHWTQDPTRSVWTDLNWRDSKEERYHFYDGGVFGAKDIAGSVIIRRSTIQDAFNGIRMKSSKKAPSSCRNLNVEVYGNKFRRIRDNVIEPEKYARNWYFHHNDIKNAHAWFSFDKVKGGWWFYFGNTGWFTSRPGQPQDKNAGGKVLKIKKSGSESHPVWIFNNSFYLRQFVIKKGKLYNLHFLNNAMQFCDPDAYGCGVCLPEKALTPCDFTIDSGYEWKFNHDLSNKPWPAWIKAGGQEKKGKVEAFTFGDPGNGDLRLKNAPPGGDVAFNEGSDWPGEAMEIKGLEVGAHQDGERIVGPHFYFYKPSKKDGLKIPESYLEPPRVVYLTRRHDNQSGQLVLEIVFSVPVHFEGDGDRSITLHLPEDKGGSAGRSVPASLEGRTLTTRPLECSGEEAAKAEIVLPRTIVSEEKRGATAWASVDPLVRMKEEE